MALACHFLKKPTHKIRRNLFVAIKKRHLPTPYTFHISSLEHYMIDVCYHIYRTNFLMHR
ncbi:MAG: hypothetical protein JWM56_526 [Candidatus Peribacteria bacterium]|nr:hypothetical protein [Candidatus Peribacteria bacterium]